MKKQLFTLVELIIAVVVIGILAAIILVNVSGWQKEAVRAAINSNVKNIQTASDMYNLDGHVDTIGIAVPTVQRPSGIDFDKIIPKYLRAEPKKGKYWIDSNKVVWGATIEPPTVEKNGNTYTIENNKKAEGQKVYEVDNRNRLNEVTDARIADNTFTGEANKEYVFSFEDDLGLETVPVGAGAGAENPVAICTPDFALVTASTPTFATNFTNKKVDRAMASYFDVIKDSDGNYVAAGAYVGFDTFEEAKVLFDKYDKNLVLIDTFTLNISGDFNVTKLIQDADGNYVAIGDTDGSYSLNRYNPNRASDTDSRAPVIMKLSKDFTTFKVDTNSNNANEGDFVDLTVDKNGNYIAVGTTYEYSIRSNHYFISKYDKNLNLISQSAGTTPVTFSSVAVNNAGEIFTAGGANRKMTLFKLNTDLEITNQIEFSGSDSTNGLFDDMILTSDGEILVAGTTNGDISELVGSPVNNGYKTVLASYTTDLTLIKASVTGYDERMATDLTEANGKYSYLESNNIRIFNADFSSSTDYTLDYRDEGYKYYLGYYNGGYIIDGDKYIFFENADLDGLYFTSYYSIAMIKDLNAEEFVIEDYPYPDRMNMNSSAQYVNTGDPYGSGSGGSNGSDEPKEYYDAEYNPTTKKVNPVYEHSIFIAGLNTFYYVDGTGSLISVLPTPETEEMYDIRYQFQFDQLTGKLEPFPGSPIPAGAIPYGDNETNEPAVPNAFGMKLYRTGYSPDTNRVNPELANTILQGKSGSYFVQTNGELLKFDPYSDDDRLPENLEQKVIGTFSVQDGLNRIFVSEEELKYNLNAAEGLKYIAAETVNLNCFTDTYFVNTKTGEMTYVDENGFNESRGFVHPYMSSFEMGEHPMDINLYFYNPETGFIDLFPEFRSVTFT